MSRTVNRRIARLAAVGCLVGSGLVGFVPAPSSAESPQATGWWSRRVPLQPEQDVEGLAARPAVRFRAAAPQQELPTDPTLPVPGGSDSPVPGPVTTVPLPVPVPTLPESPVTLPEDPGPGSPNPAVPEGGLWVANDPTGAAAMSAIRYRGDIGAGELTLRFAPGSTTVGPVIACPALSEFQPGPAGAWRDRPAHDCERMASTGRLTPDGTGMQFTIPQGFLPFGERVLDILLLPSLTSGDVFSLYFEKPDDGSLDVTQGQELPTGEEELPEVDPLTLPTFVSDTPTFDSTGGFTPAPIDPVETAAEAPVEEETAAPTPIADVLEPFTESRTGRIISVAVLLAMGAGLWLFGGQPVRHPRLLGALAGDVPAIVDPPEAFAGRGIGRFRRVRVEPPHRL